MNTVKDTAQPRQAEITVRIYFVDAEWYAQTFPLDMADRVQRFIDWYRKPGKNPVWTWRTPESSKVRMFLHKQIEFVAIEGYIEPDGRPSKWYERLLDKLRARMMM